MAYGNDSWQHNHYARTASHMDVLSQPWTSTTFAKSAITQILRSICRTCARYAMRATANARRGGSDTCTDGGAIFLRAATAGNRLARARQYQKNR